MLRILDVDLVALPAIGLLLAIGDFMTPGTRDLGQDQPSVNSTFRGQEQIEICQLEVKKTRQKSCKKSGTNYNDYRKQINWRKEEIEQL